MKNKFNEGSKQRIKKVRKASRKERRQDIWVMATDGDEKKERKKERKSANFIIFIKNSSFHDHARLPLSSQIDTN